MNPCLSELIENYYKLTGKPIASMSVTEYLQFASSAVLIDQNSVAKTQNEVQKQVTVEEKKIEQIPTTAEKPIPIKTVEKQVVATRAQPKKSNEALEMLKSISG